MGGVHSNGQGAQWVELQLVVREAVDLHFVETDVLHLDIFGAHILVLSKAESVLELLNKRSAAYSDRVSTAERTPPRLLTCLS